MDEKQIHRLIGYLIIAIIAYQILSYVVSYLIYGVVGLVILRVLQEYHKNKR